MELTHDRQHNVAYIRLRPKNGQVETIRVSDELNIDVAPDGTVYGIELLNANEQLGSLLVLDPDSDRRREIELPAAG